MNIRGLRVRVRARDRRLSTTIICTYATSIAARPTRPGAAPANFIRHRHTRRSNREPPLQIGGRGTCRQPCRRARRTGPLAWPDFFGRRRSQPGSNPKQSIPAAAALRAPRPNGDHHGRQPIAGSQAAATYRRTAPSLRGTRPGSYWNTTPPSTQQAGRPDSRDRRGRPGRPAARARAVPRKPERSAQVRRRPFPKPARFSAPPIGSTPARLAAGQVARRRVASPRGPALFASRARLRCAGPISAATTFPHCGNRLAGPR